MIRATKVKGMERQLIKNELEKTRSWLLTPLHLARLSLDMSSELKSDVGTHTSMLMFLKYFSCATIPFIIVIDSDNWQ
jgi:hypothetical protein